MLPRRLVIDQRAISNLIATLILIAVAVVGGAFAYTAFRNQASSTTTSADLQVQSLDVVKTTNGLYASITVKNVGTQRLSNHDAGTDAFAIDVEIAGTQRDSLCISNALDPGQTGSNSSSTITGLDAGKEYVVQVKAGTPDGGSITKTMTVRVES